MVGGMAHLQGLIEFIVFLQRNKQSGDIYPNHDVECGAGYQRTWDVPNLKSFYPQS